MERTIAMVRRLLRIGVAEPFFLFATSVSLALGVGANTAVVSLFDRTILSALPFHRGGELLAIARTSERSRSWIHLPTDVDQWLEHAQSAQAIAAYYQTKAALQLHGVTTEEQGAQVSASLLRVIGSDPKVGRWFSDDEARSHAPVVVLSDALSRRLSVRGGDLLGQPIRLNGELRTVIGILPPDGGLPLDAEWWTPPIASFGEVVVLPREGVSPKQVEEELSRLSRSLNTLGEHGLPNRIQAVPLATHLFGETAPLLRFLAFTSGVLLVLATANVSNVALARAMSRRRTQAIRLALGATPVGLLKELFAELALVALSGLVAGLILAIGIQRLLLYSKPAELHLVQTLSLQWKSILFAVGLTAVCTLLASLGPLLRLRSLDLTSGLADRQEAGRKVVGSLRLRHALVSLQVVAALVSLSCVFLLTRSISRLGQIDPGFAARDVLVARLRFSAAGSALPDAAARQRFSHSLMERLRDLPGVESVAQGPPPLVAGQGEMMRDGFSALYTHRSLTSGNAAERIVWVRAVDPDYFATFSLQLRAGRIFTAFDDSSAPHVAILNVAAARLYFDQGGVVGRVVDDLPPTISDGDVEVVGVIDNVRQRSLVTEAEPEVLVPIQQQGPNQIANDINVRTSREFGEFSATLKTLVHELDPTVDVSRLASVDRLVSDSWATQRFLAILIGAIALLGLLLSSLGLATLVAFVTRLRYRELGVRAAVGAPPLALVREIARDAVLAVLLGVAIGLPAVRMTTTIIGSFLYGVGPGDIPAILSAVTLLSVVTLASAIVPALRAARRVPVDVLHVS